MATKSLKVALYHMLDELNEKMGREENYAGPSDYTLGGLDALYKVLNDAGLYHDYEGGRYR